MNNCKSWGNGVILEIEKVKDVVESLGMEVDTTDTYNKLMKILEDAHGIALDINTKLS